MPLEVLCSKLKLLPRLFVEHTKAASGQTPMRFLERYWKSVESSSLARAEQLPWVGMPTLEALDSTGDEKHSGPQRQLTMAPYANRVMDLACDMPQLVFRYPYELFYGMFTCAAMSCLQEDDSAEYPCAIQHILRDQAWESGRVRHLARWKTVMCALRLMLTGTHSASTGSGPTQAPETSSERKTKPTGFDANLTTYNDALDDKRAARTASAFRWTRETEELLCLDGESGAEQSATRKPPKPAMSTPERLAYDNEMLDAARTHAMDFLSSTGGPQKCAKFAAQCIETQYLVWTPERRLKLLLFPFDSDQQTLHAHRDKFGHLNDRLGLDARLSLRMFYPRYDLLRFYQ
jgi:hypothetical protein